MQTVILAPVRLLGDGLSRCLQARGDVAVVAVAETVEAVRTILAQRQVEFLLVDMTQPIDLDEVRSLAVAAPSVVFVALGLRQQRHEVIRCGRAGFIGYVARDCDIDGLVKAMRDALAGRLACPEEISGGLLRALFRREEEPGPDGAPLTRREGDVLQLIGRGLTNKEIARELGLSVATVKHHVHNVLEKLHLPRRAHAMRRVRERPWLGG